MAPKIAITKNANPPLDEATIVEGGRIGQLVIVDKVVVLGNVQASHDQVFLVKRELQAASGRGGKPATILEVE